jgi:hypothetical protein
VSNCCTCKVHKRWLCGRRETCPTNQRQHHVTIAEIAEAGQGARSVAGGLNLDSRRGLHLASGIWHNLPDSCKEQQVVTGMSPRN